MSPASVSNTMCVMKLPLLHVCLPLVISFVIANAVRSSESQGPRRLLEQYCVACHEAEAETSFDVDKLVQHDAVDGELVFENLALQRMPPPDAEQPTPEQRRILLEWLADEQPKQNKNGFRRLSRSEFVHSLNDLLGTELDLAEQIPSDQGTYRFDSDRRIVLSSQVLGSYFKVAEQMLDRAFPADGFPSEQSWETRKLRDSHETYRIYVRDYQEGLLFSWTRANNGNSYSFFYDNFEPPSAGWYELTFEAAKVGDFEEHVSIQVHAGKYYFADDRPQPQRLVGVISVDKPELQPYRVRAFLHPGENVSVHCYSQHTWRQNPPEAGAYIRKLTARGPVMSSRLNSHSNSHLNFGPPVSYQKVFKGLPIRLDATDVTPTGPDSDGSDPFEVEKSVSSRGHPKIDDSASRVVQSSGSPWKRKVCVDADSPEALEQVLKDFAERAFATEFTKDELAPYVQLARRYLIEHGDFVEATKVGLKSILCSARFLLVPGEHSSIAYHQAAGLARMIWRSVPDETLLRLAERSGAAPLADDTLRAQIHRMLADRRSDRMVASFTDQWLNLKAWDEISPSLKLYPSYDDLLHYYLPMETRAYVTHLIRQDMPVTDLIDSDYSFLNQRLAQHYGISGVLGQDLRKQTLPAGHARGGLLTMGSVLKITTDGFDTSPILRGAWISKNIVGNPIAPPPASVAAIDLQPKSTSTTLREKIEQHKQHATCYACHKMIDGYGFALESFDGSGEWRERYRVAQSHQGTFQFRLAGYFRETHKVDASGEVDGQQFQDVFGLKELLLSKGEQVGYNFAKQFFQYANGYSPTLRQRLALLTMVQDQPSPCRVKRLVIDVLVFSLSEQTP